MTASSAGRYVGRPLRRREDERLVRGAGRFVADLQRPGTLHLAVLRSPHAHARIVHVDAAGARALPGVHAAVSAADLGDDLQPIPLYVPHPALVAFTPLPLARGKVRYAGEPVAAIVADSRYLAEDALEAMRVEYEPLPAVTDARSALEPGAPVLHEAHGTNLAARLVVEKGTADEAFARAEVVVAGTFAIGRVSPQAIEPRGLIADWDAAAGRLTVYDATQSVHMVRRLLAHLLRLSEGQIRVVAPDVGGGFGGKNRFYPEEFLACYLSRQLGRPVAWIADRREDLLTTYQEREQVHQAELAATRDGVILGVRGRCWNDTGAYAPFGIVVPYSTITTIPGPYRVPHYRYELLSVYTNKPGMAPYRGAGRPQASFVMERLLDLAADRLGLDRLEIRRRNLITPAEQPYDTGIPARDGRMMVYDGGDYPAALERAAATIGYEAVRAQQRAAASPDRETERAEQGAPGAARRAVGVAVCPYIEMAAIGPFEGARIEVDGRGHVAVYSGAASQGQGIETALAQICAERLGVPLERITVVLGDTASIARGVGTWASRTAVAAGNAVSVAAARLARRARERAAVLLEAACEDLEVVEGMVRVRGTPTRAVALGDLVLLSDYPNVSGRAAPALAAADREPGLQETEYYRPPDLTYAYGAHAAVVEVDLDTARVRVLRYVVVHDCGRVLNPMIVDGQVRGAVAQGMGAALLEEAWYDEGGQPRATTYLDYLTPTAGEVPRVEVIHMETPAPNPEGVKGTGEGGTIPVAAVLCSAIEDALRPLAVRLDRMPVTPERLWRAIREARAYLHDTTFTEESYA
ncbi:MAG: xanthine dehydrogenase family protein molybdopterin-binding subunit [Armatimonadota bacterium]|nr:xanthine dehydrogenase family protein molybdopterin-binding subunit [Armatimonadota bacterium]